MSKFKVGDFVKGTTYGYYGVTNERMTKGEVVALLGGNGIRVKVLKHGNTGFIGYSYSVSDKYFELFEEPKKVRDTNFKIDEEVRVRSWDDMEHEYGLSSYDNINCFRSFTQDMKHFCGQTFHIVRTFSNGEIYLREITGYQWSTDMIEHLSESTKSVKAKKKPKVKMVKCANCGAVINRTKQRKASNGNYVCDECSRIKYSGTQSTNMIHKHNKSNKTYGFELECVPRSSADKLSMINRTYGLIPTSDGSLPSNGIEFKTPIYNGLNGLRTLFKSFDKYVKFSSTQCGQHINIGDTKHINLRTTDLMRVHAPTLFDPLYRYMVEHKDDTTRVCGRYFTGYADRQGSYTAHSSWIAISESERMEFRLSKFKTPNQYFELTNMWTEMIDCLIENFFPTGTSQAAIDTSAKLIEIFKVYADGNAKCQKNSKKCKTTVKTKTKKAIAA